MTSQVFKSLVVLSLMSGVLSDVNIKLNHDEVTVKVGEEVDLLCSADVSPIRSCFFDSPADFSYPLYPGASYENRIHALMVNDNDCGIKISDVRENDDGVWECTLAGQDAVTNDHIRGSQLIKVVVAVPPSEVYLRNEGQDRVNGAIVRQLSPDSISVDCVATAARPAPTFQWFIGNEPLQADNDVKEEDADSNKNNYISTMTFTPVARHNGQKLRCEVQHSAYSVAAIEAEENVAAAQIQLEFSPTSYKKDSFDKLMVGERNTIRIKFLANPKPEDCQWTLGQDVVVVCGEVNDKYESSHIQDGDMAGEYFVSLDIVKLDEKMTKEMFKLDVTNNLGTTAYEFHLDSRSDEPSNAPGSSSMIGIIVLVVAIVLVGGITALAKARGMLCFANTKKTEDAERAVEKEGSDTESAEHPHGPSDETDQAKAEADKDNDGSNAKIKGPNVVTRVSHIFAAVRKSVAAKGKEAKYASAGTPESEMKLRENDEKKEDAEDVTYADIDKSALGQGSRKDTVTQEDEKTQYAEIKQQK